MLTSDQAFKLGLQKYRDYYPEGEVPADLEEAAVLSQCNDRNATTIRLTYTIRGSRDPFVLFQATIDHRSGSVVVEKTSDWRELANLELDDSKSL